MDESRHPPSSPRAASLPGMESMPAHRVGLQTQAGPVTGFGGPCASQVETPRDEHPHYSPTQEVGLLVHKESDNH